MARLTANKNTTEIIVSVINRAGGLFLCIKT